jgi:uncharacterized protein (DUF362 family)
MKSHPCQHKSQDKSSHSLSRKEFLRITGASASALLLASCQRSEEEAQATQTPADAGQKQPESGQATSIKPVVGITKAENYDPKMIRTQLTKLLDSIGGLGDVLAHGKRVAIKVNLTGGISGGALPGIPEVESFLTHPTVVLALCELLRDAGAKDLFIVEAVYEKESWPHYGYTDMAKSIGATLVDLNYAEPYKDLVEASPGPDPAVYQTYKINPILQEIDAFISVSKMKCHNTAGVTHTMKNLFGLVPFRYYTLNPNDRYRSGFHGQSSETRQRVPKIIVDLNRTRPINLSLIDGIWTTEAGEGPWITAMSPLKPNVMIAGKDPVATDAVATAAMGFDPATDYPKEPFVHAVNHLNIAAKLGLGTNLLQNIQLKGYTIDDVKMNFKASY